MLQFACQNRLLRDAPQVAEITTGKKVFAAFIFAQKGKTFSLL